MPTHSPFLLLASSKHFLLGHGKILDGSTAGWICSIIIGIIILVHLKEMLEELLINVKKIGQRHMKLLYPETGHQSIWPNCQLWRTVTLQDFRQDFSSSPAEECRGSNPRPSVGKWCIPPWRDRSSLIQQLIFPGGGPSTYFPTPGPRFSIEIPMGLVHSGWCGRHSMVWWVLGCSTYSTVDSALRLPSEALLHWFEPCKAAGNFMAGFCMHTSLSEKTYLIPTLLPCATIQKRKETSKKISLAVNQFYPSGLLFAYWTW